MSMPVEEVTCSKKNPSQSPMGIKKLQQVEKPRKKLLEEHSQREDERIKRLEREVNQLRAEMECIKREREAAENAVQKAILRGARALGGRFKAVVPESIEKLLDTCDDDVSSTTTTPTVLSCTIEATSESRMP